MSRFGTDLQFNYTQDGLNWLAGTGIQFDASQMPQYPMEESRQSDRRVLRNLNGDAYVYQNYTKQTLNFRWTYLAEAKVNEMRNMFNANWPMIFLTNGTIYGTFILDGDPQISETQFEMYDVSFKIQEQ
jgi:hypothetical protein